MARLSSSSAQRDSTKRGSAQSGRDGEDLAVAFLRFKGAEIIARNWRPTKAGVRGEIDIIARSGEFLCFVEVKTRRSEAHGAPQEAVDGAKQRQISRLANAYLSLQNDADVPCRFDIIEVWLAPSQAPLQKPRINWLENAFDFQG